MKRKFNQLLFLMFMGVMLASSSAFAQTTIRGNVTDDTGEALIGANVIVKGSDNGDVTDIDGNYTISTSDAYPITLVFSYTGFTTQEVDVTSSSPVNVTLVEGILSEEVVISASRRREKVQEAPASISVITARKLESTANGTDPTRNLISTPGVQIQQQSANRINISMRGGAGLFGTSAFPIMDYRSLVGAGIGTFQSDGAGISNIDLERIEVVRGPGSALYGPGVTQGVIHFITKSPIDYPCTTVELMGGELQTFGASARHATKVSDKFGFKINATYRQGNEFTLDPDDEMDAIQIAKFKTQVVKPFVNSSGYVDVTGTPTVLLTQEDLDPDGDGNMMAKDWHNVGINATLEFRPKDNLSIVTSGGFNNASSVFYNEQGEGLAQATEYWGQARMQAGGLFAQVFGVLNDGGSDENPTFLYQTGNSTSIGRTQLEAQVQYNWDMKNFLNSNWTAGFDYRFAGQDTENLVYGRNEDDDDYSVVGGYVQAKFALSKKLDFVAAGRYDQFNFIDDGAFAPRAALVFKVNPKHTFRASYNRANSTVSNLQLNIDFPLSTIIPGSFDVWLYGNKVPQTFENAAIKWFNPALPDLPIGTPGLPMAVPYGAVAGTVNAGLLQFVMNDPNLSPLAPIIEGALNSIDPSALGFVGAFSPGFNIFDGTALGLTDAPISAISTLDAFEIGYKGLIGNKLGVTFDVYQNTSKNFSQFTAISPAYIYGGYEGLGGELGAAVAGQFGPALEAGLLGAGLPQAQVDAIVGGLVPAVQGGYTQGGQAFLDTPTGGAGTATPSIAQILAALPFHATTPTDQVPGTGGTHLAAGYRTFTERSYVGADLGLEYYVSNDLSAFFNYSWVSDTEFMHKVVGFEDGPDLPSYLNTPKNKFRTGLTYSPESGFRGSLSFQHDDSYFASAGQYTGDTEERNLVDASFGYKFNNGLAIDLSASNLFNNEYRYLPNMPKIGRRALAKLVYNIGCGNNSVKKPKMAKADRDGDGIRDSKDRCPDIAGIKKHKGCPMSEADMAAQAAEEAKMAAEAKAKAAAEAKARAEEQVRMAAEAKAKAAAKAEEARVAAAKAAADAKIAAEKAAKEATSTTTTTTTATVPQMGSGAETHSHGGVSHSHQNSGEHVHRGESAVTGTASASDFKSGTGAYTHSHAGIGTHSHDNNGDHTHTSTSGVTSSSASSVFESAMGGINFRSGQDRFRSSSYAIMDNVVTVLQQSPNMTVTIEGHTDSQGSAAPNKALSQKRANAVKAYLVSKGISANRMTAIGYGEERPIADNKYAEGRAKNRRVVFIPSN